MGRGTHREAEVERVGGTGTHREAEVERLGHAVVPGPDVVQVPGDGQVDGRVDQQHDHGVQQAEVIVHRGRLVEVGPASALPWDTVNSEHPPLGHTVNSEHPPLGHSEQ